MAMSSAAPRDGLGGRQRREFEACYALLRQEARGARSAPRRDDKVLADWNGLAIAALAHAAAVLDRPTWLATAERSFAFVATEMSRGGRLVHSWCEGELGTGSILDDYGNMALAGLALFESTGSTAYLEQSKTWIECCVAHFRDPERGTFFYTPDDASLLFGRICDGLDTATPSGNGVIADVLARLHYLTGEERFQRLAGNVIAGFAQDLERNSFQLATLLDADQILHAATQVVIVGAPADPETRLLSRIARRHAPPDRVICIVDPNAQLTPTHPAAGKTQSGGLPTAYLCVGQTCSLPVSRPGDLRRALVSAFR